MSLRRLLRSHLGPYRQLLVVVVVFQAIQTFATLTLPSLNADIIDKGVLRGDDGFIVRTGVIVEQGDHDALLAAGGAYARLHDAQFAGQPT